MSEKPTYEELEQRIQELEQTESESKRVEEALRESEAKLLEAQSVGHIGNWAWNLQTNQLSWSEENYRIFGLPLEVSPSYETFEKAIHLEDRAFVNKSVEDALKRKKPYNIEFRIILPDDKEGIVHAIGKVDYDNEDKLLRFFGTVQDITDRKRAEEELALKAQLLDASTDFIFLHDFEGNFIYVNNTVLTCKIQPDFAVEALFYVFFDHFLTRCFLPRLTTK